MFKTQEEEAEIDETAYTEIVKQYGIEVVKLEVENVSKELRCALMAVSDIWMLTSLRQGYSLYPLEYIAVRGLLGIKTGSLILSTFSGSINTLTTARIINPYDVIMWKF